MMRLKIRKKDTVVVISGREKGRRGEVLKILPGKDSRDARVLIAKVNIVTKHARRTQADPGGIQKKEAPMPACKVMLLCPKCQRPVRPKLVSLATGEIVRTCRRCSEVIL